MNICFLFEKEGIIMAIKERRWLDPGDLRKLCIEYNWFAWGTVEQYDRFLYMTK